MAKEAGELTKACRELFGKNIEITYQEALPILKDQGFDLVYCPSRKAMKRIKRDENWEESAVGKRYKRYKSEQNSFNVNKYVFKKAPERAPISEKPTDTKTKKVKKQHVADDTPKPRKLRRGGPKPQMVEMTVEEAITYAKEAGGVAELVKSVGENSAKIAELQQAIAKAKAVVDKLNSVKDDLKSAA